ncbi:MAG: hypothetical protein KGQ60_00640, partial [Planctomycetes bacterium]|nr:hypothetical protein [Planctomycetota bacterium]
MRNLLAPKALALVFSSALSFLSFATEPARIELWPQGAPGSQDRINEPERTDRTNGACNVTNVHTPSLTAYLPKSQKAG